MKRGCQSQKRKKKHHIIFIVFWNLCVRNKLKFKSLFTKILAWQLGSPSTSIVWKSAASTSCSKLHATKEKSHTEWVNDDRTFIFRWTIPLRQSVLFVCLISILQRASEGASQQRMNRLLSLFLCQLDQPKTLPSACQSTTPATHGAASSTSGHSSCEAV